MVGLALNLPGAAAMLTRSFSALLVLACFLVMFPACGEGDGIDAPEKIVERAKSLCACESKECMDRITDEITAHSDKVKAKYPTKEDVPQELQSAMTEGRKTMLGCIQKLDQLSGHTPPPNAKKPSQAVESASLKGDDSP